MKKLFLLLLLATLTGACTAAFAQTYTARDHTGQLNVSTQGDAVTFVITSDDPQNAERTFAAAQRLQRAGTQTTVLLEEAAVRLASNNVPPQFRQQEGQLRGLEAAEERQRLDEGEFLRGSRPIEDIRKQAAQQERRAQRLEQSARAQIEDLVSYGGKVMACPRCMEAFQLRRASLQEGVDVAPLELVASVHSKEVFRAPAPAPAIPRKRFGVDKTGRPVGNRKIPAKALKRKRRSGIGVIAPAPQPVLEEW